MKASVQQHIIDTNTRNPMRHPHSKATPRQASKKSKSPRVERAKGIGIPNGKETIQYDSSFLAQLLGTTITVTNHKRK